MRNNKTKNHIITFVIFGLVCCLISAAYVFCLLIAEDELSTVTTSTLITETEDISETTVIMSTPAPIISETAPSISTPTPTDIPIETVVETETYISESSVRPVESQPEYSEPTITHLENSESILTSDKGVNYNINGNRETWYNLNMSGVVEIMRNQGFSEEEYPYWVREDGCKMLGDYIIVAANHDIYPRGSTIHTSLGEALVCDTGSFIYTYPTGIDIATNW